MAKVGEVTVRARVQSATSLGRSGFARASSPTSDQDGLEASWPHAGGQPLCDLWRIARERRVSPRCGFALEARASRDTLGERSMTSSQSAERAGAITRDRQRAREARLLLVRERRLDLCASRAPSTPSGRHPSCVAYLVAAARSEASARARAIVEAPSTRVSAVSAARRRAASGRLH